MEDTIQAAALTYWKHQQEGRSVPFCFVCARQAAAKYFYRKVLGRNPRSFLSLDTPTHDNGDLSHEWLPALDSGDEANYHLAWLSHEALERVLVDARLAAGYSNATYCAAL